MPLPHIARIYRGTPRNLAFLARAVRAGKLVAVPTETVYGLAANALDARACRKIFSAKGRPTTDPLIVHVHSLNQLHQIAEANDSALRLAKKFWPGPLTLVLPKKAIIPNEVSAGLTSVGVRMPSHALFRRLLKQCTVPLAAPSANQFGRVSPTSAEHVRDSLGKKIRYILDGGASSIGIESTIVDLRDPQKPRLLRPGVITQVELETALGRKLKIFAEGKIPPKGAQIAPGLLKRHYSPKTPVTLHSKISLPTASRSPANEAWLFVARPRQLKGSNIFWLDARGSLPGAARSLFRKLRELDQRSFARIHLERAPGTAGLAMAINDRLGRAAAGA